MNDSSSHAPGRVLADRYALDRRMGSGGAGVVWCAEDRTLGRTVAVKLLHGDLAADPVTAARFRSEAATAAKLTHPNAVIVYDIGHDDGDDYLVMEYVEGATLADVLRTGPLDPGVVAGLGSQIGRALGAAHARRLVHRDVKPANVLITHEGVAKVADFGIARAFGESATRLTLPGHVMGTARYLAPEQLRDDAVDARADVYALGVLLHEALTGQVPFGTGTLVEVASRRLVASLPPVSEQRSDVPALLDEAIARATRLDPADRFRDGEAFADELARAATKDVARVLAARVAETDTRTAAGPADGDRPPASGVDLHVPPATDGSAAPDAEHTRPLLSGPAGGAVPSRVVEDEPTQAIGASGPAGGGAPGAGAAPRPSPPRPPREEGSSGGGTRPAARPEPAPRRRGPVLLLMASLMLVAIAFAGVRLLDGDDPGSNDGEGQLEEDVEDPGGDPGEQVAIEVVASRDHDPFGSGEEHRSDVPNAFDGDASTSWQTQRYRGSAELGGLKPGVGIWAELAEPVAIDEVAVELSEPGAAFTLYVADDPPDPSTAPEDWGTAVAEVADAATSNRVALDEPTEGRVWLVWFTTLPPDGGEFRAVVPEVELIAR